MPILFSLYFCVALGVHIESRVGNGQMSLLNSLTCAGIVQALFLTPAWTTLYLASPAYAWLYRYDPVSYPELTETGWATLAYNLASFLALLIGRKAAQKLRTRHTLRRSLGLSALGFLIFMVALFRQRLFYLGDYEAFWLREAPHLWHVRRAWAVWFLLACAWATPGFLARRNKMNASPRAA